jgi:hypothetical protein
MIHTDYIVEILGRFEGKAIAKGYVPCKDGIPLGASGVTIGTGFDLGQQDDKVLDCLILPETLTKKLRPYIGIKKADAVLYLTAHPLVLSDEEVSLLDKAVHVKYITETEVLFGIDRFEYAPKQVQAVAVSLHYQFGTPQRTASPGLGFAWEAMQKRRYSEAAEYLTNPAGWSVDNRQYMGRRKQEADLLREAVKEK